jgi:protein-tyrosine phosphatase
MIDMHCHFLPGLDDGAPDLETALEMARIAVADGIRFAVLTPRIEPGLHDNDKAIIGIRFEEFRRELRLARIPLRISMGSEVRMDLALIPMFGREEIPFLGVVNGYEIVLLELPHGHVPVGAARYVERLIRQRIRPIIAHPERNAEVMEDPRKLDPLLAAGSFLQLNAGSLTGEFGKAARKRARQLLELSVFKVLATDARDLDTRRPVLSAGVEAAARIIGLEEATALVYRNPAAIIFGKRLAPRRLDRRQLHAAGLRLQPGGARRP